MIVSANDQAGMTMLNTAGNNKWSLRTGTEGINNKGLAFVDETNGATRIQVDDLGNVGVATLTPGAKLDVNGAVIVRGDLSFNSGYGSSAISYGCRAWVNFNGTGTVAIRASGNVSSITDGGVGLYTVNFTTAMPDANYSGTITGGDIGVVGRSVGGSSNASRTTTSFAVRTLDNTQTNLTDCDSVYIAIFR